LRRIPTPLDNFGENLAAAGHLIHKRNRTGLFVWQNPDVVRSFEHVTSAPVRISNGVRDVAMMIGFRGHDRDVETSFGEPPSDPFNHNRPLRDLHHSGRTRLLACCS